MTPSGRPLPANYAGTSGPGAGLPGRQYMQGYDINSILGTFVDRGIWPYYDTLYGSLGTGSTFALSSSYTPFAIPLGQLDAVTSIAKTKVQTNAIAQNSFGATRCLILEQIGIGFPGFLSKANVDILVEYAYLEFKIAEKIFFEGRLELWPSGTGLMGATTATGEETWTLGLPIPLAARRFQKQFAKYIAPLINFTFTIFFPGGTGTNITLTYPQVANTPGAVTIAGTSNVAVPFMRVYMDGLTDRAVQ
jgi:hypothetical protein